MRRMFSFKSLLYLASSSQEYGDGVLIKQSWGRETTLDANRREMGDDWTTRPQFSSSDEQGRIPAVTNTDREAATTEACWKGKKRREANSHGARSGKRRRPEGKGMKERDDRLRRFDGRDDGNSLLWQTLSARGMKKKDEDGGERGGDDSERDTERRGCVARMARKMECNAEKKQRRGRQARSPRCQD
ncbi:hypothetical protein ACLOJK_012628 [Asimina triloba]